jgi:hypothetical protein
MSEVNFLSDDAALAQRNPSSASTTRLDQAQSSATRPPHTITLSAPTMYVLRSSSFYTTGTSSMFILVCTSCCVVMC